MVVVCARAYRAIALAVSGSDLVKDLSAQAERRRRLGGIRLTEPLEPRMLLSDSTLGAERWGDVSAAGAGAYDVDGNSTLAAGPLSGATVSAAPGAPALDASCDTGTSSADGITQFNNAAPAKALKIRVPGTTAGSVVSVYAGGLLIGSATSAGGVCMVTTDGSTTLADGARSITARQTEAGNAQSADSAPLMLTIDTVAFAPAAPDLQAASDSGSSSTDNITNVTAPVADVTVTEAGTIHFLSGSKQQTLQITSPGVYPFSIVGNTVLAPVQTCVSDDYQEKVVAADLNEDGTCDLVVTANYKVQAFFGLGGGAYGPAVTLSSSGYPEMVGVGYFDADGHQDIVTANGDGKLAVHLGKGDGTFVAQPLTGLPIRASSMVVMDANGDGKPDVLLSTQNDGGRIYLALGSGDGVFGAASLVSTGQQDAWALSVADFNGDGALDFAGLAVDGNAVHVYRGNGNGTFGAPVSYPTGTHPVGMATGDLNDDGRIDLVVAESTGQSLSVLLGNGDGTFQARRVMSLGLAAGAASAGDFNGDGKLDVAICNRSADTVTVLLGQGDGSLVVAQSLSVGSEPQGMVAQDLNGDGQADLVVSNRYGGKLHAFTGEGGPLTDGVYTQSAWLEDLAGNRSPASATLSITIDTIAPAAPAAPDLQAGSDSGVSSSDNVTSSTAPWLDVTTGEAGRMHLDIDGISDAVSVPTTGAGTTPVKIGGSGTTFQARQTVAIVPGGSMNTKLCDVNGDGRLDILTDHGVWGSSPLTLLVNSGGGTMQAPVDIAAGYVAAYTPGDFNNDGKIDLFVIGGGQDAGILMGNGNGTFGPRTSVAYSPGSTYDAMAADLNKDGKLDVVAMDMMGGAYLLLGNGNGTFQSARSLGRGELRRQGDVADVNGDGLPDVIAHDGSSVYVFLNAGSGNFAAPLLVVPGGNMYAVKTGDFDGDGKLDLALACYSNRTIVVMKGSGNGTFGPLATVQIPYSNSWSLAVADFNGDGKLDVAGASDNGSPLCRVTVALGNGLGAFPTTQSYDIGLPAFSLVAGDLNGDGRPDLVAAQPTVGSNATGNLSMLMSTASPLTDGVHTVRAWFTDAAGNVSAVSDTLSITVDTVAPAVPSTPDLAAASDSGVSSSDNITSITMPAFGVSASPYFRFYRGGTLISGNYQTGVSYTAAAQADGTYNYTVAAVDAAGNVSAASAGRSVTIDTVAPTAPAAPDLQTTSDSGVSSTDNITSATTPTFNVSGSPYFRFYRNGSMLSGSYQTGTTYSLGVQPDGTHSYTVAAVDAAGNVSPASVPLVVTIDTAAPTDISISPGSLAEHQAAGTPAGNFGTTDPSAGDAFAYSLVSGPGSTDNGSFTISGDTLRAAGSFNYETKDSYSVRIRSTDRAGLWTEKAFTISVTNVNEFCSVGGMSKSFRQDTTLAFSGADFVAVFSDPDVGDSLQAIQITALPTHGTLRLGGLALGSNQVIAPSELGTLTYTPAAGYVGADNFGWTASDGSLYSPAGARVDLTIQARSATTTAVESSASNSTYGQGLTFTATVASADGIPTGSVQFLIDGSPAGAPVTLAAGGSASFTMSLLDAGSYSITASYSGDTNFSGSANGLTQTVKPAALTVSATPQTKTYGQDNPTLSGTINGIIAGDAITVGYTTDATQVSHAGEYVITPTLPDPNGRLANYAVTLNTSILTIDKAYQTINWATPAEITYGTSLSDAQLNATVTGVVGGSAPGALSYDPLAGTILDAGSHTLSVLAAATEDYYQASRDMTLVVRKAALTVSADPQAASYGQAIPTLTGTLSGVVGDDDITASYTTSASLFSHAGDYAIIPLLRDPDGRLDNYDVTLHDGTLTIIKVDQTITWPTPMPMLSGTGLSAAQLSATAEGIAGGSAPGALTYSPAAGTLLTPGSHTLTVTAAATADYNEATLSVDQMVQMSLVISGTTGNDQIVVSMNGGLVVSRVNGAKTRTPADQIASITVNAGAGADTVLINAGVMGVLISAGRGNDTLTGGDGNDTIQGGKGSDLIRGGLGDDLILGGAGDDTLYGDAGKDTLNGEAGRDLIDGGANADTFLSRDAQADTLFGGAGADTATLDDLLDLRNSIRTLLV